MLGYTSIKQAEPLWTFWVCGCGLNLMIISVSSKAHFYGQNTVDNHIPMRLITRTMVPVGVYQRREKVWAKIQRLRKIHIHSKGFIIICKHMECTHNITLARKSLLEYVVPEWCALVSFQGRLLCTGSMFVFQSGGAGNEASADMHKILVGCILVCSLDLWKIMKYSIVKMVIIRRIWNNVSVT